ncbi:MAG TPA: peptide-methionine (S)-S-oxide reductase MsrA [Burkholderiales bacterium]
MSLNIDPRDFPDPIEDLPRQGEWATAVLAGGCFWCTEAVYRLLDGVLEVRPGYAGGSAETANYETVCTGRTGHAEAIEVRYDPRRLSYGQLLKVFFSVAHDPTQVDRQGNDVGTQYRSAVFYADDGERRVAAGYIRQLDAAGIYDAPIATRLEPLDRFYPAEDYHYNYAERHPNQPYIRAVALPKVEKLKQTLGHGVTPRADAPSR